MKLYNQFELIRFNVVDYLLFNRQKHKIYKIFQYGDESNCFRKSVHSDDANWDNFQFDQNLTKNRHEDELQGQFMA